MIAVKYAAAGFVLLALALVAVANVTVGGSAYATLAPDSVAVTFAVQTEHPSVPAAAQAANDSVWNTTRADLTKTGLAETSIVVTARTWYAQKPVPEGSTAAPTYAWFVRREIALTLRDGAKPTLAEVAAVLTARGHLASSAVNLRVSDLDAQMDTLRKQAVTDAKRRAELYAREAGITLTGVLNLSETKALLPTDASTKAGVEVSVTYGQK